MTQPTDTRPPRIPKFHPVPVKRRADGWTPLRQCEFIGMLAETGSVSAAAQFVGMARETAYRLRRKPGAEGFAHAWDMALLAAAQRLGRAPGPKLTGQTPKVTARGPWQSVIGGTWRPVLRRGKYAGSVNAPDKSALCSHLAQLDRALREGRKDLRAAQRSQTQNTLSAPTSHPARLAVDARRW